MVDRLILRSGIIALAIAALVIAAVCFSLDLVPRNIENVALLDAVGPPGIAYADTVGAPTLARMEFATWETGLRAAIFEHDLPTAMAIAATHRPIRCDLSVLLGNMAFASDAQYAKEIWSDCPTIQRYFLSNGDAARKEGDWSNAAHWYRLAAELPSENSDRAMAYLALGSALLHAGEDANPILYSLQSRVEHGELAYPDFVGKNLGRISLWELLQFGHDRRQQDGNCDRADFWYGLANRFSPASEYAALYLAICAQDPVVKQAWLLEAQTRNPESARVMYWMGHYDVGRGDCQSAVEHFIRSLELQPGDAPALLQLGRCYLVLDDDVHFKEVHAQLEEINPDYADDLLRGAK